MRQEDAQLEKILRDYNNEVRQSKKKRVHLEKPLDQPYYKGIQMPEHLKWVTIHSVSFAHFSIRIGALAAAFL